MLIFQNLSGIFCGNQILICVLIQGFKGIITSSLDYNYWLKRLESQLNKPKNPFSKKIREVIKPTNKKHYSKTLDTSVINNPVSSPSLIK